MPPPGTAEPDGVEFFRRLAEELEREERCADRGESAEVACAATFRVAGLRSLRPCLMAFPTSQPRLGNLASIPNYYVRACVTPLVALRMHCTQSTLVVSTRAKQS